jgi:hypothetical protein
MGGTASLYCNYGAHKLDVKKADEKAVEYGFNNQKMSRLIQIMKVLELTWPEVRAPPLRNYHPGNTLLD